jgi:hypothetical protein
MIESYRIVPYRVVVSYVAFENSYVSQYYTILCYAILYY